MHVHTPTKQEDTSSLNHLTCWWLFNSPSEIDYFIYPIYQCTNYDDTTTMQWQTTMTMTMTTETMCSNSSSKPSFHSIIHFNHSSIVNIAWSAYCWPYDHKAGYSASGSEGSSRSSRSRSNDQRVLPGAELTITQVWCMSCALKHALSSISSDNENGDLMDNEMILALPLARCFPKGSNSNQNHSPLLPP